MAMQQGLNAFGIRRRALVRGALVPLADDVADAGFRCDECGKKCGTKGSLATHKGAVHGIESARAKRRRLDAETPVAGTETPGGDAETPVAVGEAETIPADMPDDEGIAAAETVPAAMPHVPIDVPDMPELKTPQKHMKVGRL